MYESVVKWNFILHELTFNVVSWNICSIYESNWNLFFCASGRTHRSNQVSAPEYIFMISELAGERRFAATVAKRLESLGALTHGDRRATESRDLSRFNIDNKVCSL